MQPVFVVIGFVPTTCAALVDRRRHKHLLRGEVGYKGKKDGCQVIFPMRNGGRANFVSINPFDSSPLLR
jgi:hypothetical protein